MRGYADEQVFDSGHHGRWTIAPAAPDVFKHRGFDAVAASQAPCTYCDALREQGLPLVPGFQRRDDLVDKSFEIVGRFIEQYALLGCKTVLQGVQTRDRFTAQAPRPGAELSVAAVGFNL